ncbi:MAG: hypothetical protein IPK19_26105 [Chloroflexi bacterium]|nr:hypothetical protein [Chloroflexota bacterium]
MLTRDNPYRFSFWIVLILALFLLLFFLVHPVQSQTPALTQIARSLDGQISVRLPEGWQSRDAASPVFTTTLTFGDSAEAVQAAVDALAGRVPSSTSPRNNGVIGIFNPTLISGLSTDLAISTLLNALIQDTLTQGGQVLEQQSLMLGGLYPGSIAVVEVRGSNVKGIVGVFQAGADIVEFSVGAMPTRAFDANQQLWAEIVQSIRVPAEEGSAALAVPTTVPVNEPAALGQTVQPSTDPLARTATGTVSARLPDGWVHQPVSAEGFTDLIAFGSTAVAMQTVVTLILEGGEAPAFSGMAGLIGAVDMAQMGTTPADQLISLLMQDLLNSIATNEIQVTEQPTAHTFGGLFPGELAAFNMGFVAVLRSENQLAVALVLSDDFAGNRAAMAGVLETIRLPAENAGSNPAVQQTQPAAEPTAALSEMPLTRSSDNRVSFILPAPWTVLDHMADAQILAFGDTFEAADSRLTSARPDLGQGLAMTGVGGLIILYPMANFGIDPASPDLAPLMAQALGQLQGQGYTVEEAAQPFADPALVGQYALIKGAEQGYLALMAFGDQVAYVTATGLPGVWTRVLATDMFSVVTSVRVPAAPETPETGGLGGLGGLGDAPTATPAGLGGLGS